MFSTVADSAMSAPLSATRHLTDELRYDTETRMLHIGTGTWGPVSPEVWAYEIGMRNAIGGWFNYRRTESTGRMTSPLDEIVPTEWSPQWTNELTDLLSALQHLVDCEPLQRSLLDRILDARVVRDRRFV